MVNPQADNRQGRSAGISKVPGRPPAALSVWHGALFLAAFLLTLGYERWKRVPAVAGLLQSVVVAEAPEAPESPVPSATIPVSTSVDVDTPPIHRPVLLTQSQITEIQERAMQVQARPVPRPVKDKSMREGPLPVPGETLPPSMGYFDGTINED
jgi:hypothetical protein